MAPADRVAVVTGAAKPDSIGHAVAVGLAREGADVVVADLYESGFPEITRAVEAAGRRCLCVRTDVADPASVEAMVSQAVAALGRLDVLVNAVGGSWGITPQDLTAPPRRGFVGLTNCSLDDWRTILAANLDGAFYCARAAAPHLIAARGGAIVNFASVAARKGLAPGSEGSSGPYAVAKAGIMALTRQLALELGPHGVRVNCVAPGVVLSGRARRLMAALGQERGPEGAPAGVPLGRFAEVAEVAALVVALCTDETAYVTGATIDVNGASYMA
jgi:NAD(P)-dependent dehydrogenase (short-subunit alcohol dehydrogenase family)